MKKIKKVYGVYNIIEWIAVIKIGKASMKIPFSGGAMTTQGVTPATFTTADPVVQLAIEQSGHFKSGKIILKNTYPTNEEINVERNAKSAATDFHHEASTAVEGNTISEMQPEPEPIVEETMGDKSENIANSVETPEERADDSHLTVKVACDRDAAEYLRDHHGIAIRKLTTKEAIAAAAQQYGVTFIYPTEDESIAVSE